MKVLARVNRGELGLELPTLALVSTGLTLRVTELLRSAAYSRKESTQ